MATKKTTSYNVLLLGILSLLAVGTWVFFDIYRGLTSTTLTEVQQKYILPLKVDVDQDFINSLLSRRQFDDLYLSTIQSREVPLQDRPGTVTPELTPTPTVTPQVSPPPATASATPVATESASQQESLGSGTGSL